MIGTNELGVAVELPDSAVTQGFALLARRRSGKSTLAGVIEETFCERGDPWVCLDPVSAHWGIRYQDDKGQPGKPSGYEVLIVGGKYGDVPIDEKAGGALAQILVDTDISCVVDLGGESMNARQKFVADFAIELLRINSTPRHVLIEECDEFVPQQLVWDNQKYVRGALERLIKQGGGLGIGFSLISQRPASVAKNVLEQIDHLYVLRMKGPNDLKAVQGWFEHNVGDKAEMNRILTSITSFQPGEAWLCSSEGELERFKVRQRRTYHAGRTPKRGEAAVAPKRVELGKVIEKYSAAATKRQVSVQLERDLKAENQSLKKQLVAMPPATKPCDHEKEIAILSKRIEIEVDARESFRQQYAVIAERMKAVAELVGARLPEIQLAQTAKPARKPERSSTVKTAVNHAKNNSEHNLRAVRPLAEGVSKPQQRILNTLATFAVLGIDVMDRSTVAVYSEASPRSSAFGNNLGRLSAQGLIAYPRGGAVSLTAEGTALAEPEDTPQSVRELHERWFRILSAPQVRILEALLEIYDGDIAKEDLAQRAEASVTSSAFGNNLGHLRSLGLIDYPAKARVAATRLMFPEGLS